MSTRGCLTSIISQLMNLQIKYRQISQDENKKANTRYFGLYSIAMTVVTCAFSVLIAWGVAASIGAIDSSGIGAIAIYAIVAVLVLCELVLIAELALGGLLGVIYQLRCNRRPIGWIALAIYILVVGGMIAGVLLLLAYVM